MAIAECDDYVNSIQAPQLIKTPRLQGGRPEMNGIRPVMYTGGYCVVFPYTVGSNKYAVRCWHASLAGTQDRTRVIAEYLKCANLPYFVDFQYAENGIATSKGVMPLVIMDWVDAKPLKKYIAEFINDSASLEKLAANFLTMVKSLHAKDISHGDLQHGNILVKGNGDLILVDYDSMYVPNLQGYTNEISGLKGYQHPARWTMDKVSPKADYFSELIIYTSIKTLAKYPELWEELQMEDTDTLIFSGEDIESKGRSEIFSRLRNDPYLKELVEVIVNELYLSSIEELLPLELIEPGEGRRQLIEIIRELSGHIHNKQRVEELEKWFKTIDHRTIEEINAKHNEVQKLIKREGITAILSNEWGDNGTSERTTPAYDPSVVIITRKEWS